MHTHACVYIYISLCACMDVLNSAVSRTNSTCYTLSQDISGEQCASDVRVVEPQIRTGGKTWENHRRKWWIFRCYLVGDRNLSEGMSTGFHWDDLAIFEPPHHAIPPLSWTMLHLHVGPPSTSQARSTQNQPTTGRGIPSPRPQLGREMLLDTARWRKGCENASNQTTQHLRALVFSILRYFSWFPSQPAQRHLHTCNFTLMIGSTGMDFRNYSCCLPVWGCFSAFTCWNLFFAG